MHLKLGVYILGEFEQKKGKGEILQLNFDE